MRFQCTASPECLQKIRAWVRDRLCQDLPPRCADEVCLAIDEACANVVRHAYGGGGSKGPAPLEVEVDSSPAGIRVVIRDRGRSADEDQLCGRPLDEVRPGGLGWHFIENAFPQHEYRRKDGDDGWNQLTLFRPGAQP